MSLLLSNNNVATPGIRRRTLSSRVEIGTVTLTFVIIALALAVSLFYLAHANRTATRGYALKKLEIEKNTLHTQSEIWQQQISVAKSLATIKNSEVIENMRPVKSPIYINSENLD